MSPKIQDGKNSSTGQNFKRGIWLRSTPDPRDYNSSHPEVEKMAQTLGVGVSADLMRHSVDLRKWCTPVENQGHISSCTANAGVGIIEYFQKKAYGKYFNGSRLFLYKVTRKLLQKQDFWKDDEGKELEGDFGADIRSTMGALAIFGIPDEKYWPYTDWPYSRPYLRHDDPGFSDELARRVAMSRPSFDDDPSPFVYGMASRYKINMYFSHDPDAYSAERQKGKELPDRSARSAVLASVKKYLASGIPSLFGFHIYPSFDSNIGGIIPFPNTDEYEKGQFDSHAVAAVGYDDRRKIKNADGKEYTGALLFRNSWAAKWGERGYGWLPYEYVLTGDATDFWSMINMDWLDTDQFGINFRKDDNTPPVFGTFKVTVVDGVRIRSTPETTNSDNIRKLGRDTKGKNYNYDKNTVKPVDSRLWVEVWTADLGAEEYLGWMCVKEGNVQYTDTKF